MSARARRDGLGPLFHRWYQTGTGRYTRTDPLGLLGGMNVYSYAEARPSNLTDVLGLTTWTCTGIGIQASLMVGASVQWGSCRSECSGGFRWVVDYQWRQLGFGASVKFSLPGSLSLFKLDDGSPRVSPDNFRFVPDELCSTGGSVAIGAGFSLSSTQFGRPGGRPTGGAEAGLGAGIFTGCGAFKVKNPRRECCALNRPLSIGPLPSDQPPRATPTIGPAP